MVGEAEARSDVRRFASGDKRGGRLDQAQPDLYETSSSFTNLDLRCN